MNTNRTILLIGACGSGKTWTMKELISMLKADTKCKAGKVVFQLSGKIAIVGNYDGSTFEGSDKLSMAVMSDADLLKTIQQKHGLTIICEGDRFTNSTFISKFNPTIIKITDNGAYGRQLRQSSQTDRHIRAIQTRVNNIKAHIEVTDSIQALKAIKSILNKLTQI